MELNVYWTDFAKSELKHIFEYYRIVDVCYISVNES